MRFRRYLESKIGHCIPDGHKVPSGFHLVGHVALLHTEITNDECLEAIAQATLDFDHRIRSVAVRTGPTLGDYRVPQYRLIGGDENTVTSHIERGVIFRLDPIRVTFSGGNKRERVSIADRVNRGEAVVDMFACVGQFALHIARKKSVNVTAIEINPTAYSYLVENVELNGFKNVNPVLGDCRLVHPSAAADRVIMGYLHDTIKFLPAAFSTLKPEGGVIHMHIAIPPQDRMEIREQIGIISGSSGYDSEVACHVVKRYSPGIDHCLYDIKASGHTP